MATAAPTTPTGLGVVPEDDTALASWAAAAEAEGYELELVYLGPDAGQIDRTLVDSAAITDSASTQMAAARTLTDSAAIVDSASTQMAAERTLTDSAAITDSASTALAANRTLTDSAAISDSASTQLAAQRQLTDAAAITDSASWALTGADRYIDWMGHNWWVRGGFGAPTQSNPNNWGNTTQTVEILPDGKLKLSISQVDGQWRSAEVDQNDSNIHGYGRYRWVYDIDAVGLDHQPVLGLYVYDQTATAAQGYREMDIEVTRWGVAAEQNVFWYSVHPTNTNNEVPAQGQPILHRQGNHRVSSAGPYTSEFIWQAGQVYFRTTAADGSVVGEHVVTEGVQAPGNQRLSMNFWLNSGTAGPANGQPVTATIHSFEFTPDVTHALVPAAQYFDAFPDVQGWSLRAGASIAGGDLLLPTASTTYSTAYTGHVLDMRGSSAQVEITGVPAAAGNLSQEAIWHVRFDENNEFMMILSGGNLQGRVRRNGTNANTTTVPYNATTHRWWRMVESGGTLTFQTSANGSTWATLASASHTLTAVQLSAMRHQFDGGTWDATDAAASPAPFRVASIGVEPAVDYTRTLTDSAAITDSASTRLDAARTLTDAAALTDSASTQLDASRALADSAAITDSASTVLDAGRALADSAAITDSATWSIDRYVTLVDSAGITDSAAVSLTTVGGRQLTDFAAITDSASWTIDRYVTLVDNAGITDSASTAADYRRTLQDSAALTDSVTAEITAGAVQLDRLLTDAAGITDAAITWLDRAATLTDAAALTDSASWSIDRRVTLVDSAALTDTATADLKIGGATLVDAAAITDSASWRIDRHVTLVDSAAIGDTAIAARHIRVTLVDSAGITDSGSAVITVGRNITVRWSPVRYRTLRGTRVVRAPRITGPDQGGS